MVGFFFSNESPQVILQGFVRWGYGSGYGCSNNNSVAG